MKTLQEQKQEMYNSACEASYNYDQNYGMHMTTPEHEKIVQKDINDDNISLSEFQKTYCSS